MFLRTTRSFRPPKFTLASQTSSRLYSTTKNKVAPKDKLIPTSGIYPHGFKVVGIHSGVGKNGKRDLGLIVSDTVCNAAAVFTTNIFKAAPVLVSKEILEKKNGQNVRALTMNSGCANAVTGTKGLENARKMVSTTSSLIGEPDTSIVMSTGVIGQHLQIDKITNGIQTAYPLLSNEHSSWLSTAEAFMTTDTFPKLRSREFTLPSGTTYRMAGISKGAGMIHPNMATLLSFIATDAAVSPTALRAALKYAVDRSFNSITIDGDMSTNDTLAIFANGASGGTEIRDERGEEYLNFRDSLTEFAAELAKLVVRDGEGATKFVTVRVKNASTYEEAKQIASTISTSSLVKTALYGQDANWGRILCATGYAGVQSVEPTKVSVSFVPTDGSAPLRLLVRGEPENVDEDRASEILQMEDLEILVDLGPNYRSEFGVMVNDKLKYQIN
ncbi:9673_t:CDS:2 [Paraglomus occultum]|uniref:Arginine biosynthesis bifunctional protein ArgJ, mitochondrial n=1 Tax=Paraglomus occultum TaxID=144539 RepID=A0A9N8WF80_9GLOM|nr:9673_t:CDS:2 [Paraglomus occultum]